MEYPPNLETMKRTAEKARKIWSRLKPGSLSRDEAEAFIALGRLEQFSDDVDTVIAASMGF